MTKKQLEEIKTIYDQHGRAICKSAAKGFKLVVFVGYDDPEPSAQMLKLAGGRVDIREFNTAKLDSPHRKNYTWALKGADAIKLANDLLPLVKEDRARDIRDALATNKLVPAGMKGKDAS